MRALLVLVPWMAMATAAMAGEVPASLVLGHREAPVTGLVRDGDQLFASEAQVRQLGWTVLRITDAAELDVHGKRIRIPIRRRATGPWLDIADALKQIDADTVWLADGRTLRATGRLSELRVEGRQLRVVSNLPMAMRVSRLAAPERLIYDFTGVTLPSRLPFRLPPDMRAGQFRPNVVRVVVQGDGVQQFLVRDLEPASVLDVPLPPVRSGGTTPPTGATTSETTGQPTMDPPVVVEPLDPQATDPASNPEGLRTTQGLEITEPQDDPPTSAGAPNPTPPPGGGRLGRPVWTEDAQGARLTFPTGTVAAGPIARYVDPLTVEFVFPRLSSAETMPAWTANDWIRSLQVTTVNGRVTATVGLMRPAGFTLNPTANRVVVTWVRPKGQDGRLAGKVIVLDPGHGGIDGGARSPDGRVLEKNLALSVARQTATLLSAEGAAVILTRSDDRRIPLRERSEIANRNGAAAFVSIHFNSNRLVNSKSGTMTFYHRRDPVGILLAECLQRPLVQAIGLPNLGTLSDTRIYSTGFAVLRHARVPSVLLELGFINHSTDRARLTQPAVQARVARAIVTGLRTFLGDAKTQEEPAKQP